MAELREAASAAGFTQVATYLQSGNLRLASALPPGDVEAALQQLLVVRFGVQVETMVRTAAQWRGYASGSPFPDAEQERPQLLLLAVPKRPLHAAAAAQLQARADGRERVAQRDGVLWIDFGAGIARTRLTPTVLERAAGSALTTRNWRTVLALDELVRGAPEASALAPAPARPAPASKPRAARRK